MHKAQNHYPDCPEAMIVGLARAGDRLAFEDLVRRKQSSIRHLMRRCSSDVTLADDLAQQVFLQVWLKIRTLKEANAFGAWLKRLAISVWLQYLRKQDALRYADNNENENVNITADERQSDYDTTGLGMDLEQALATLSNPVRLCIVLSYHEGMTHREIAESTELPLGTVKSHINRGTQHLQKILAAYNQARTDQSGPDQSRRDQPKTEESK